MVDRLTGFLLQLLGVAEQHIDYFTAFTAGIGGAIAHG